ncbi:hypothetical protein FACS18948_4980 [Clostridia bacterium]|nr:hypothetical protein FACS18948_4980 [Clostridia bacterium]
MNPGGHCTGTVGTVGAMHVFVVGSYTVPVGQRIDGTQTLLTGSYTVPVGQAMGMVPPTQVFVTGSYTVPVGQKLRHVLVVGS